MIISVAEMEAKKQKGDTDSITSVAMDFLEVEQVSARGRSGSVVSGSSAASLGNKSKRPRPADHSVERPADLKDKMR